MSKGNSGRGWSNGPLIRETDRSGVRSMWSFLLSLLIAAAPATLWIFQQNHCWQESSEVERLGLVRDELIESERRLQVEVETLTTLDRLEDWATNELGLTPDAERKLVVRRAPPVSDQLVARGDR